MKILLQISMIVFALTANGLAAQNQYSAANTRSVHDVAVGSRDSGMSSSQFIHGEITIKLKEGVGEFGKQSGSVQFGFKSLEAKVADFEVYQLEKGKIVKK